MPNNNDNYEYMKFLDLSGAQQIWNTCKQTFVRTVNGVGIDANGNCQVPGADALSIYPVGSIYLSVDSTSPASLFGGTWQQIKDTFILAAGDTYSNGATGGASTHNHANSGYAMANGRSNGALEYRERSADLWNSNYTVYGSTGGSTGTSNINTGIQLGGTTENGSSMPPYLVAYVWKRTA